MQTATASAAKRLLMPVPEQCSDCYAAGWAYADWFISRGGDLNAAAPSDWHEEKVIGFWDRLRAEREVREVC